MQTHNIYYMPHHNRHISTLPTALFSSINMTTNYLPQHPQAWAWETPMDHHHHLNVKHHDDETREFLFEKPLTPSDVGKLNRLVIPKQNAEKYLPLAASSPAATGENVVLLSFEDDESGKEWRFRYSYWTSSQSYVLTKGWSRFVKEKHLGAGDIVMFHRRRGNHLLYIGCRRFGQSVSRAAAPPLDAVLPWTPVFYVDHVNHAGGQTTSDCERATAKPVSSKRLIRLFGVNLDCGPEL